MTTDGDRSLDALLQAGRAGTPAEFYFTIVNRSVAVVPYDRASLWQTGGKPRLLAVSGSEAADPRAPFAASWTAALRRMAEPSRPGPVDAARLARPEAWAALEGATGGLGACWLPLPDKGMALLVERWGGAEFSGEEISRLDRLVQGFALLGRRKPAGRIRRMARTLFHLAALAAIGCALALVRVPLRVVAECEVTARDPRLVSAPMDGVVDEVLVAPGERVDAGAPLAAYDSRLMEEELKISRRQVEVVEAELASARARGFSDPRYRGETAILEARLEQEMARLEALEVRFSRRIVTAPGPGMVQLDDARAWRGRPVSTGQAILWLVDPLDTRVTLWLPQDDRIEFDAGRPISVHLHALGAEAREARIVYMSSFATPTADGRSAFPAEAEWLGGEGTPPPLGLRGTASIYGEEVRLGYWLLRRPMAWLRRWAGV